MKKALVTGSGGLVGSECAKALSEAGWAVVGIDNNMRRVFFGEGGSVSHVVEDLVRDLPGYRHEAVDLRDHKTVQGLIDRERPDLIIHTAGQPSHDRAADIAMLDFEVNASATVNLLTAVREYCADSPFCFTSTNKVYGDGPNHCRLTELDKRYDLADYPDGIPETFPIDHTLHSVFGASKLAADVMCQEFGRYFQMPIGVFRAGCLTGPQHAAVALHGYLAYIVRCAVMGQSYTVFGYKGKQVRDQLHCRDVANLFLAFYENPRCGEAYNIGGGKDNSLSILETIETLGEAGHRLPFTLSDEARKGDHICYYSDLAKVRSHFPNWTIEYDLNRTLNDLIERYAELQPAV